MQNEVLIVGAGPTELVLALTLDRFNVPFTIIEKKTKPNYISKAIAVVPGTLEHYSQLGIVEEVLAEGISPKEVGTDEGSNTIRNALDIDFPGETNEEG